MPGLYVHIPFCSIKCYYCDFTAFAGQGRRVGRYLEALKAEARGAPKLGFETLYIGGGTPSELSAGEIWGLFRALKEGLGGLPAWTEATFEANPESLNEEKITILKDNGITRVSLGLQTTDNGLLKNIGRKHGYEQFLGVYGLARSAGLAVNVDLMYGLPGQSISSLEAGLDAVLALRPDHLSLYGLQVEDRTLFARRGVEADEDTGRVMFELALDRIERAGLRHYEISNFARPGRQSRHNLLYWTGGEYVGLGCGAASFVGGDRWSNVDRLGAYCDAALTGESPRAGSERLEGKELCGERLMLGLRTTGGTAVGPEAEHFFARDWVELEAQGLIEKQGPVARLTRSGIFLANRVFERFVTPFEAAA